MRAQGVCKSSESMTREKVTMLTLQEEYKKQCRLPKSICLGSRHCFFVYIFNY